MSISTATDDRTEGDDDTSQGSQPKDESSESENENENEPQNQNGGGLSPEVHEITSDDEIVTNDDESSNSSSDSNDSSEDSQQSNRDRDKNKDEEPMENGEESDIEEVNIEDPLNQVPNKNKPIVINDTKNLAELASKQSTSNGEEPNKEPTVVIIDTNSILSGKGPTAMPNKTSSSNIDAHNLCQSIAARGTTITPISSKNNNTKNNQSNNTQAPQSNILPSLTDDMFVVEAPSFIVPYVYEKPSLKPFREFVDKLGKELEDLKAQEEEERQTKEKAEKERKEKERKEKIERGEAVEEEEASDKDAKKESEEKDKKSEKRRRKRRNEDDDDDSWDGESTSESDEAASDDDTVVIKDKDTTYDDIKDPMDLIGKSAGGKSDSYFDCSLGQFFINIGINLVQEYVQSDLLKTQNRKMYKEKKSGRSTRATEGAIASLTQNLAYSKKLNAPYALQQKQCEFCSFKTESMLVMSHHLEAPHMKNNIYKCNTCAFEIRSPHDILFHMEAEHNIRGRLERAPAYQQCPSCHFEDNSKTKLARHLIACAKKFKPEFNLGPPLDWEPPAKIPKLSRARNNIMGPYQSNFNRSQMGMSPLGRPPLSIGNAVIPNMPILGRPRGRPPLGGPSTRAPVSGVPIIRSGVMIMHNNQASGTTISNYPVVQNNQGNHSASATPKISITPLPRVPQPSSSNSSQNSKATFVICEICDGYIKDLEQLRNHMQWIHKVKIHPKMIYNRPPLNCQKCQFRFFTDQGLERHLLGSHGLVTSSMQEAANKGKDAGRCPVCGRVYQWKLLNHVSRDHNMTLKPAHLSYKCTVCTATFGMYKQFENHVYSAHSVVAKRVIDKNKSAPAASKPTDNDSLLKPLKISDEITIIPQPAKSTVTITAKGK
ncbi:MOG interacting and ectopic P-granules protein 1 [Colias croceus]|uniref:MOG interacting and ectopic P-granules protein 1 n=1 Tax=Colias crocea TaxID=72248 RepID=UPI001E27A8A6|nr:MOG interacting and ectopic P-granules protein 1 [Colias croceus]